MKEEELIKKLEKVELPRTELESHRQRLRMAVLNAGHLLNEQPRVATLALVKAEVSRGMDMIRRGLVSRQPVWKTSLVYILTVALIAGLAIALPLLIGQSPEELAASIVRKSPEVWAALAVKPIEAGQVEVPSVAGALVRVELIEEDGDNATVLVRGEWGRYVIADVNLGAKEVTRVYTFAEFSDEEKARAIEIARADPKVQELLDKGGKIDNVISLAIGDADGAISFKLDDEEGEITVENVESGRILPTAVIVVDNQTWLVFVDIDEGEVVRILNPKLAAGMEAPDRLMPEYIYQTGTPDLERVKSFYESQEEVLGQRIWELLDYADPSGGPIIVALGYGADGYYSVLLDRDRWNGNWDVIDRTVEQLQELGGEDFPIAFWIGTVSCAV
jgi:hypothetical protein